MKKIITIVGARPQFIKAAVISRELRERSLNEIIVHTGQHYDYNMSEKFFRELEIPNPKYNLNISGGSHAEMTGKMMMALEEVLILEKPDLVIIYGDTNSTLAGALAAAKLYIPICHIEAGGRSGELVNPEEINRITADHLSSLLMCCVNSAMLLLKREGLESRAHLVGDPMLDAYLYYRDKIIDNVPEILIGIDSEVVSIPNQYYYLTMHREENTQSEEKIIEVLDAMEELNYRTIYPLHPRVRKVIQKIKQERKYNKIIFTEPVGYLMSVYLIENSTKIITDSGGLQREAFFARKPCITISDYPDWPETLVGNQNQLSRADKNEILEKVKTPVEFLNRNAFGDGFSAKKICNIIAEYLQKD